jgi:hypothetical protein
MNHNTASALNAWSATTAISAVAAALVMVLGSIASCSEHEENAKTDRVRSNNDAIVKLIAAGVSPQAARCAVNDDRSSECALAGQAAPTFVSSIRSDELPAPALTPFEQGLLGKKP